MANNDDDMIGSFDDAAAGDDLVMDDLDQRSTLADVWRNNPMVKVAIVLGVLAVLVGGMVLFGGDTADTPPSSVGGSAADVKGDPGKDASSDVYVAALEDQNNQNREQAILDGTSAIPIPIAGPSSTLAAPEGQNAQEDPLQVWRTVQDQQQAVPMQSPEQVQAQQNAELARREALNTLANAMSAQMGKIIESRTPGRIESMTITSAEQIGNALNGAPAQATLAGALAGIGGTANGVLPAATAAMQTNGSNIQMNTVKIMLNAGTIEYAQLLLEANTDAPGPVLAQIVTGPFNGGRAIGTFTNTDNYLVLNFHTLVKDSINYPINAVAVDPTTTLPGLVTEIDHRYFKRVILPAAARFVEGMGQAIADSGSNTTVTIDGNTTVEQDDSEIDTRQELYNGVEEGANELSEFLSEEGDDTEPMIRVKAGTPIGIFFTQPVTQTLDANGNVVQQGFGTTAQNGQYGAQGQQQQGFFPGMQNMFGMQGQQQQGYYQYGTAPYGTAPYGTTGTGTTGLNPAAYTGSTGYQQFPFVPQTTTQTGTTTNTQ